MKIYFQGKRMRDFDGKFSSFKIKAKRFFRKLFLTSALLGIIYLAFLAGRYLNPNESIINVTHAEDTLSAKVESLKDEVVETIRKCEALNYTEEDALITFDPDPRYPTKNIPSIGEFQYKAKTVKDYYALLYGKEITLKEATLIALDTDKARQLTKDIIFKDTGKGIGNWWNCQNKHNLKKVDLIKKLEQ